MVRFHSCIFPGSGYRLFWSWVDMPAGNIFGVKAEEVPYLKFSEARDSLAVGVAGEK